MYQISSQSDECVESRRGGGVLEASCDNFFLEASRVKNEE